MGLAGTAVVLPVAARAEQADRPVIGYLGTFGIATVSKSFLQGLHEAGYIEGQNVSITVRSADAGPDQLPSLAADLVGRHVSVIVAVGSTAAAAEAKALTRTIPIVFLTGGDPVRAGLVASLSRPGGNVTGATALFSDLVPKRLELLRQLVPSAVAIVALVDPKYPDAERQARELREAAAAAGHPIRILRASTQDEIDAAFATVAREGADALLVANDPFFDRRRDQLAKLAARHRLPAIYSGRSYVAAGGLASYGADLTEAARQVGIYTGRILKGAKPADLPVIQASKFELVINLNTARSLGLTIPQSILLRADEVIQ